MIDFDYSNKKTNIKVNILLAAFLEDEFYDIEVCLDEINKSLQENIGIWTYVHKTDDGYYHPVIYIKYNDKHTVIHFHEIKFDNRFNCFKNGLKVILAYICYLVSDNKNTAYNIVEHDIIKVAIKNSDIDIEKLCESLNL